MARPELAGLELADPPELWEALGFAVSPDGAVELGGVRVMLGVRGEGIVSWTLRGIDPAAGIDGLTRAIGPAAGIDGLPRGIDPAAGIDGLPTQVASVSSSTVAAPPLSAPIDQSVSRDKRRDCRLGQRSPHPNGAIALDHVVILTSDFDRTATLLAQAGMPLRRLAERNGARQGFRRLGPVIMEIVQAPDGPTRFWGLVVTVSDLGALAERLGDRLGEIRPAVQPGRHIATLRHGAGLGQAVAFMSPETS